MKRSLSGAVCVLALLCASVPIAAVSTPAYAQSSVSFDSFHRELARYGDWVYSDRWGEVWLPDVDSDFRPYGTDGHWVDTEDYGWTWVSDYPWGDIAFHYGRWVDDPDDGWMWIPGYVWSPAWVVWRSNDQVMGWMPMPPDRGFLSGDVSISGGRFGFSINFDNDDDYYGYRDWYGSSYNDDRFAGMWIFVGADHFADRDFRRYERPRTGNMTVIRNTRNITNYTVVNNVIVNRSVDARALARAGGRPVKPVRANTVLHKPQFITQVDQGQRLQQSMRAQTPRGTGAAGSAPRPTPTVANTLSDKMPSRRGQGSGRLLTRQNVEQAPAAARPATPTPTPQAQPRDQQQRRDQESQPQGRPQQDQQRQFQPRPDQAGQDQQRQQQDQQRQLQQRQEQSQQDRQRQEQAGQEQQRLQQERQLQQRQEQQQQGRQRQEQAGQDQQRLQQEQQRQVQQRQEQQQNLQRNQQQQQQQLQQRQEQQQQERARGQQPRPEQQRPAEQRAAPPPQQNAPQAESHRGPKGSPRGEDKKDDDKKDEPKRD